MTSFADTGDKICHFIRSHDGWMQLRTVVQYWRMYIWQTTRATKTIVSAALEDQ